MTGLAELISGATSGPMYSPDDADRADIRIAGLDLPVRATAALFLVTFVVLLDYTRTLIPADIVALGRSPDAVRYQALERFALFGVVPLAVVLVGFRDRPARYGLQLGDWRWGLGLLLAGVAVMTPIILGLARQPQFSDYYGAPAGSFANGVVSNALEIVPAEFLLRGFLMFALLRRIGPLALVVVQVPFIFAHIGKPELELWSTFVGGTIFAWLDWRTGSIVWSALGHLYVLTLMMVAVGAVS
ncbi:MAG TPA: CPBP family intramembrane glutamic endopeptidase [Candidatus Limnocylindrales bacterium]|nr:CPBP family intramembrane glutamic endopeptidase [Candidatus Limnocylindrales bacterium]